MTINAVLKRLVLSSPHPEQMANFYRQAFDYEISGAADEQQCEGDARSLWIRRGAPNQLLQSHFAFADTATLDRYIADLRSRDVPFRYDSVDHEVFVVVNDPEGREVWFGHADRVPAPLHGNARPARLQHYAVRTRTPQRLVDFYANSLGFAISDLVRDAGGDLTAAFLRTDGEHHALAIFRAPEARFDHFSCETLDWHSLRDWADHMAARAVKLVWGIGRHGPGNDTFFMVHDPDSNLAEISSELEICAEDRPIGSWQHRMETLNQWGVAIMRS